MAIITNYSLNGLDIGKNYINIYKIENIVNKQLNIFYRVYANKDKSKDKEYYLAEHCLTIDAFIDNKENHDYFDFSEGINNIRTLERDLKSIDIKKAYILLKKYVLNDAIDIF
jgi:hypothetical protein